ncbi:S-layer homology domain-containing protein [Paenibacillus glycinis]|uniref:SLH domain-containing protein n=1 Tax=Paenibacillus glycinis TaxID=2697035 RepID=A0ABW9XSN5_9BACL|nr:S-layer homology domain-containing protein [Paenibacillus glycinis]NBD25663.1 hypothetical protein [Paenibacillus glycinis]
MRKTNHKILLLLLAVTVAFGTLTGGLAGGGRAYAASPDFPGSGTSADPYLIATANQLNKVRDDYLAAGLHYRLIADIDLSGYAAGTGWTPIGNQDEAFYGQMDGNGFTINGLTIDANEGEYVGLFGYLEAGSALTRMKLANVSLSGSQFVGGLAGYNNGGQISGSAVSGTVVGTYNAGGLIGYNADGAISDSRAAASVTGNSAIGGLIGHSSGADGAISGSYATGNVTGTSGGDSVGGLVGYKGGGSIYNSHASGKVNGKKKAGGLIGDEDAVLIHDSYATGDVNGNTDIGGLVGSGSGGGEIVGSRASGKVSGRQTVGGLIGRNYGVAIGTSHASGDVTGGNDGASIGGLVGDLLAGTVTDSYASGTVSGASAVAGLIAYNESSDIIRSYALGNVNGSDDGMDIGGLVGINKGLIAGSFAVGAVTGGQNALHLGGLIGDNFGPIRESFATGAVTGGDESFDVGGLAGNSNGAISASYAAGDVAGSYYIGGLAGYHGSEPVSDSYASGSVNGIQYAGGLLGYNFDQTIGNSYASGAVSAAESDKSGGLIAYSSGTTVNSFYDANTTGQPASSGGDGKTTAELRTQSTYETDVSHAWDFAAIWAMDGVHSGGYPYLRQTQAYADYDANGSDGGLAPVSRSFVPGGAAIVAPGPGDMVKAGYAFGGWNTQADGGGTTYKPGETFVISGNTVLYANWIHPSTDATLTSAVGTVSVGGTPDERIADVPYGTALAAFAAGITPAAGAEFAICEADGTTPATELATGVKVIVTAQDGTTRVTYTVQVAGNSAKAITGFSLAAQTGWAAIDAAAHTVAIEVGYGTDVSSLTAAFALSAGASAKVGTATQASGVTANDFASPVLYEVTAEDGSTQNWTVTVTVAASGEKDITAFGFAAQTGPAAIDAAARTVAIEVAAGTSRNGLVATFALSPGASAKVGAVTQVSGTTANNFGSPVTYAVKAADGSTQNWRVTVTVALSSAKAITAFSLAAQTGPATIDAAAHAVTIEVANGTSLVSLRASFTLSTGASAKVGAANQTSGVTVNNFTNPVTYTVRAADGSTQSWVVTVTVAASSAKAITAFSLAAQTGPATIDAAAHTVGIEVENGTDVSSLPATFTLSVGATAKVGTVDQVSGVTVNNYTNPLTYIVRAADGSMQSWIVTVTVAASSAKAITAFSMAAQIGPATIDAAAHTVGIEVENGTDVGSLAATFTLSVDATAKVGTVDQVSGVTANNFTNPVTYTVKAADGSMQSWIVTVTVAASSAKAITAFSLAAQTGPATIDGAAHTVRVEVENGTDVGSLPATFTLSVGATTKVGTVDQVSGVTANDFTNPVSYIVTAADGSTQSWTVTVTIAPSSVATLTSTIGTVSAGGTANETITNIPHDTTLTALKAAITPAAGATFDVYDADGVTAATVLMTGKQVIVTAQDGMTKTTYAVTVNAAPVSGGGGGGGSAAPVETHYESTNGKLAIPVGHAGTVSLDDEVIVTIPANAAERDLVVTIDKLTNPQSLLSGVDAPVSGIFEITKNFTGNFAQPVTISILFEPAKLKPGQTPAVFYYDEANAGWIEIAGGIVSGRRIAVTADHFATFAVFAAGQPTDAPADEPAIELSDIAGHWAEAAIKQADAGGIVSGYPDGSFRPNHPVTRAEFAVMLMHALKPEYAAAGPARAFVDDDQIGAWAKEAVAQAAQAGIISGYADGSFRANAAITRAEMAVMLARAPGLAPGAEEEIGFSDDGDIPAWARAAIAETRKLGLIEGTETNAFRPHALATRAEAAVVLLRLMALRSE